MGKCLHHSRSFSLVEIITVIVILAILVTVAGVYIGNYLTSSKTTADRQTLAVLNDALTRYKTQGGSLAALTASTPIAHVVSRLQTPVDWCGLTHQFLQTGKTYLGRSISALGAGSGYRFSRYNTYEAEAGGTSPTPLTNGLVGWWKLNQTNGATDLSGSGNNGTASGGLTFGTVADHNGTANGAAVFDGLNDYVSIPYSASIDITGSISTSAWIKPPSGLTTPAGYGILSTLTSPYEALTFYYRGGGTDADIRFVVNPNGTYTYVNRGTLSLDQWNHVTCVWNGSTITVYINGTAQSASGVTTAALSRNIGGLRIGYVPLVSPYYFSGAISDVRIYNRALSAAEVLQLYNYSE